MPTSSNIARLGHLCAAALVVACGTQDFGVERQRLQVGPGLTPIDCPTDARPTTTNARCLALLVPEEHGVTETRGIEVGVLIAEPDAPLDAPPVVYLGGGPGHPSLWPALDVYLSGEHPITEGGLRWVFVEPRGVEWSWPQLVCSARPQPDSPAELLDAVRDCHRELTEAGFPLDAYDTEAAALDVVRLLDELGIGPEDEWFLYGVEYGAVWAQRVMRHRVPTAVILDGASPLVPNPAADVAARVELLERVFADCAADLACGRAFPDLSARARGVVEALDADPIEFGEVLLDGALFAEWLVLLTDRDPAIVPAVVAETEERSEALLAAIADSVASLGELHLSGVPLSMYCADQTAWIEPFAVNVDDPLAVALAAPSELREMCTAWDVPPLPPPALPAEPSARGAGWPAGAEPAPVVLVTGTYDGHAPSSLAPAAKTWWGDVIDIEVPRMGWGFINRGPCARSAISRFFAAGGDDDPTQLFLDACPRREVVFAPPLPDPE